MDNNGIMYPITIPEQEWPRDDNGNLLVTRKYCYGVTWGDEECVNGGDSFLRNNDSPQNLVPPNWISMRYRRGRWVYHCPACVATIRLQNETDRANGIPEDEIEEIGHEGQSSNEPGTGRAIHGHQQPPQESRGEYLQRLHREASEDYLNQRREFRRTQGRHTNKVEAKAIAKATGSRKRYLDMEKEKNEYIEILRELNISYPQQEKEYVTGEYITTLFNLIPKDYKKNIKEPTRQELKEQAKKLYKDHPEHLKAVLQQIDKDEEGRRKKFHDRVLGNNISKKRGRDKDTDDSKKKKKKRGGRRKTHRKSRRRKRRKTRRKKKKRKKRTRKRR